MFSIKEIFNKIYAFSLWSNAGYGSGIGSEPSYNKNMRAILTFFVINNNIKSICDAGCGACKWTTVWLKELETLNRKIEYFGIDVSPIPITKSKQVMASSYHPKIQLNIGNITRCSLPKADLLFCRDVLQHMSYENIKKCLKNFAKNTNIKYYIIGGYWPGNNKNINTGDYFDINLTLNPFNLIPDKIISEDNCENHPQKHFFIFKGDSFRQQVKVMLKNKFFI